MSTTWAHTLLVARLKALTAVQAIVGDKVFPIIAPQGTGYPAVVYQVMDNEPELTANGTTDTFTMRVRVSALALTGDGENGYSNAWDLAAAVVGDCSATPSGLNGWADSYMNIWHLERMFDEIGEIVVGRETFDAFCVNMIFRQVYALGE